MIGKLFIFFMILGLAVSLFVYIEDVDVDHDSKEVKVNSIFGCVALKEKYTESEWEDKQNFREKILGYRFEGCS